MTKQKTMKIIKGSSIGAVVFALLAISILGLLHLNDQKNKEMIEREFQQKMTDFSNPFLREELKIQAGSALVVEDKEDGYSIIFGKNINQIFPIASLAKMMTVIVAGQWIEMENIESISIQENSLNAPSDFNFTIGENWKPRDLLIASMVASSNTAIESVSKSIKEIQQKLNPEYPPVEFVDMMNEISWQLGLTNTSYLNITGLDIKSNLEETKFGATSSAFEIFKTAKMLELTFPGIAQKTALKEIVLTSQSGKEYKFENTNPLIGKIPILFSKTGYTEKAGGSLIIRTNIDGKNIFIVVLGSTKDGRFSDVEKLFKATSNLLNDLNERGVALEDLLIRNYLNNV